MENLSKSKSLIADILSKREDKTTSSSERTLPVEDVKSTDAKPNTEVAGADSSSEQANTSDSSRSEKSAMDSSQSCGHDENELPTNAVSATMGDFVECCRIFRGLVIKRRWQLRESLNLLKDGLKVLEKDKHCCQF